MTQANIELLNALREAGASAEAAEAAARSIAMSGEVATKADLATTKADLKTEIAELESRLTWRLVMATVAIIGAIIGAGLID